MIEDRQTGVTVDSTIEGQRIGMTVDANAMAHIMNILTDLYEDAETAVLREYATNALDAHIAAGNHDPIEVDLPTPLSPFLRIKDRGIGLTVDDIRDIYSKYGASTKRGTNDATGMLGLGCKSALTLVPQFTLTGIKDGVRCMVSVAREEDGSGVMTVLDTSTTDEPNGVEVHVPVQESRSLMDKAEYLFGFWGEGTVLLNGEAPKRHDGIWITDNMMITDNLDCHTIVMGGVPYPMTSDISFGCSYSYCVVYFAEIGDVHFTPSREALNYTPKTKQTIEEIIQIYRELRPGAIQAQVDQAPDKQSALKAAYETAAAVGGRIGDKIRYKGEVLPNSLPYSGIYTSHNRYGALGNSQTLFKLETSYFVNAQIFYNWTGAKFNASHKRKIETWYSQEGIDKPQTTILLECPKPDNDWLPQDRLHDWNSAKVIKAEVGGGGYRRSNPRPSGSYEIRYDGTGTDRSHMAYIDAEDIDTAKPLYYVSSREDITYKSILSDGLIVIVFANRINKFKRDFPMARDVFEAAKEKAQKWEAQLSTVTRHAIGLTLTENYDMLRGLDPESIDDPELSALIRLAQKDVMAEAREYSKYNKLSLLRSSEYKNHGGGRPFKNYPLVESESWSGFEPHVKVTPKNIAHITAYVNAVYSQEL